MIEFFKNIFNFKIFSKLKLLVFLSTLVIMFNFFTCFPTKAAVISITNYTLLSSVSDISESVWSLNSGNYNILVTNATTIDLKTGGESLIIGLDAILTIGASAASNTIGLLTVENLKISGNSDLTSYGGNSGNAIGIDVKLLIQDSGALNAYGGKKAGAYGANVTNFTLNVGDGQVNATGGTIVDSFGLNITNDLIQNGGIINANGGSGTVAANSRNAGLYVGNLFTLNSGILNADGGTKARVYGAIVENFILNEESGKERGSELNATGGAAVDAFGLSVTNNFTQNGGVINANGGSGNASANLKIAGIHVGGLFTLNNGVLNATGGTGNRNHGAVVRNFELNSENGQLIATGGSATSAIGLNVENNFVQNGGEITVNGGSVAAAYGLSVGGKFTQNSGVIYVEGGTIKNAYGLYVSETFIQNNGILDIISGSVDLTYGLNVGDFIQEAGSITVSSNSSSIALYSRGGFTQNSGSLVVNGNNNTFSIYAFRIEGDLIQKKGSIISNAIASSGIYVNGNFVHTGGTIKAEAQAGVGVYVKGNFTQSEATEKSIINAQGGSANNPFGIYVIGTFEQINGIINAQGGTGIRSYGLRASNFIQHSGSLISYGGAYDSASGTVIDQSFIQNNGEIYAYGSNATSGHGISITNGFIQNDGKLTAIGGSVYTSIGLYVRESFIQNGGEIIAIGGSADNAYGISANPVNGTFVQSGGKITAVGGSVKGANGIHVGKSMEISGELELQFGVESIIIEIEGSGLTSGGYSENALVFNENSTLKVQIDFNRPEGEQATSIIINIHNDYYNTVADDKGGNVLINEGAKIAPNIINLAALRKGESVEAPFIIIDDGELTAFSITGTFDVNDYSTLTHKVSFLKYDKQYVIRVERSATVAEIIKPNVGPNTLRLIEALGEGLDLPAPLSEYQAKLESITEETIRDIEEYALDLEQHLVPHEATRFAEFSLGQINVAQSSFLSGIGFDNHKKEIGTWLWNIPFINFGTKKAHTEEYENISRLFKGTEMGIAHSFDNYVIGAGLHYIDGRVKGNLNLTRSKMFGIIIGAKYDLSNTTSSIEVHGGYSFVKFEQRRLAIVEETNEKEDLWLTSSPLTNVFHVGISMANSFVCGNGTLVPSIGLNYTYIDIKEYEESNEGSLGLSVKPDIYMSLKGSLGISANLIIDSSTSLNVHAKYMYEFLDTQTWLSNYFISSPETQFLTEGEKLSHHRLEAGSYLTWTNNKIKMKVKWDLVVADKYVDNLFTIDFRMKF